MRYLVRFLEIRFAFESIENSFSYTLDHRACRIGAFLSFHFATILHEVTRSKLLTVEASCRLFYGVSVCFESTRVDLSPAIRECNFVQSKHTVSTCHCTGIKRLIF